MKACTRGQMPVLDVPPNPQGSLSMFYIAIVR